MNALINGLTPSEHFHLHGCLPAFAVERLLDQAACFEKILDAFAQIEYELEALAQNSSSEAIARSTDEIKKLSARIFP